MNFEELVQMADGKGDIFASSNCAYTGLALSRYERMIELWRKYGNYDNYDSIPGEHGKP